MRLAIMSVLAVGTADAFCPAAATPFQARPALRSRWTCSFEKVSLPARKMRFSPMLVVVLTREHWCFAVDFLPGGAECAAARAEARCFAGYDRHRSSTLLSLSLSLSLSRVRDLSLALALSLCVCVYVRACG
jgi:hypothetical protein